MAPRAVGRATREALPRRFPVRLVPCAGIAPEGKHLLEVVISHWGEKGATRWRRWQDARAAVDRIIEYVRWYYTDLDECVEWSRYQYLSGPEMRACYLKPVARHPVKVPTVEGLYMAGCTSEGQGAYQDLECEAALAAVELVERELPRRS
jgi:hypothetical protein